MGCAIIFILPNFSPSAREIIIKAFGTTDAVITDNIEYATTIITPRTSGLSVTMYDWALKQIGKTEQEINKLYYMLHDRDKFYIPPLQQITQNKKHTIPMQRHALNQFTQTQNTYKPRFFNRTKHK